MYESGAARGRTVTLGRLTEALAARSLLRDADVPPRQREREALEHIEIDHLTADSRAVGPNGLFVAIRGEQADGHLFIDKAVDNGAIAIVHEATPEEHQRRLPGVAFVPVSDSRRALAVLAAAYCGDPSRALDIVGVTGTNGKTTTAWLIYQVMQQIRPPSGLIGTIEYRTPERHWTASHTTPDALAVQALLSTMRNEGARSCAMEVSSHALVQCRVEEVRFAAAVFTNLTQDHLDYHGDMTSYRNAKKLLFDGLSESAVAVYNADDPAGELVVADTRARRLSYGTDPDADITFAVKENRLDGLVLAIDGRERRFALSGRFNAYNLVAAYAAALALGADAEEALEALANAKAAAGRLEFVQLPGGPAAVVDYAHTPDALQNVLEAVADVAPERKRWCVFGCGGDRDRTKRPLMAAIAERYADHVVVTDDNPRSETSEAIFSDIAGGFAMPDNALWIADREGAIEEALRRADADDVVVVAGKGHETYQIKGDTRIDFDDRAKLREVWARLSRSADSARQ